MIHSARSAILSMLCFLVALSTLEARLAAQAVCATCNDIKSNGNPVNDLCTRVIVTWQRDDAGDCTLNPAPKCIARVNCLFSMTVLVVDLGCGALYWSKFCTNIVDQQGNPIGVEVCGPPSPFSNPTIVADWPVPCGRADSLKYERTLNGQLQVVAQPMATCTACPPLGAGGGGGDGDG